MRELNKEIWPYKVTINSDWKQEITPVEIWLGEQLGTFKGRWTVMYRYNCTDFYFRRGEDATLFVLRWA